MTVHASLQNDIPFHKLHSAGNDFVCVDNLDGRFNGLIKDGHMVDFVRKICRRGLGVGADGLILACERGTGAGVDIIARFLEPDGSEAKLCGNGTACFTYWCVNQGLLDGPQVTILTGAGTATGRILTDQPLGSVRVCVPNPRHLTWGIELMAAGRPWTVDYADTGVPHAVIFPDEPLDTVDVTTYGSAIRHHPRFAPDGVNANFVEVLAEGHIAVRTFEFGVESETLACGTGSAAAAIVTALKNRWPKDYLTGKKPVSARVRGGATLNVWFELDTTGNVTDVCLETRVVPVYNACLSPEFLAITHDM
ncbi:MAG: diaminopimelate epimerase [Lentisphaeria bacterium]|nr:diaminopimelate epimerase [Lentisphaeria bacterium]